MLSKLFSNKVFKIVLGSCLQWYDFALYGFFSTVFARLFFPMQDRNVALLASFGAFAIGFLARPLGALIFGRLGDIYGRTHILKITPIMITIPTVFLALLPTYNSVGIFAPILLLLTRVVQGIFLGAEFGGNMVYLCESSPKERFFLGSLGSCSGSIGILVASIVANLVSYLPPASLEAYGWRMAFLLSLIPGIGAWKMRQQITETPPYLALQASNATVSSPFKDFLPQYKTFLVLLGILCFQASTFYYVFIFLPNYLSQQTGFAISSSLAMTSVVLIVRLLFTPLVGKVADRISPISMFHVIAGLFIVTSFGLSKLLCSGEMIFIPYMILSLLTAMSAGVVPGLITQLFATRSRYTLFSFTFNTGFGIFGGCTPVLCMYLGQYGFNVPFVLPIITGAIGLIAIQFFQQCQTRSASLFNNQTEPQLANPQS